MNIARTAVGACSIEGMLYAVGGECALADTQEDTLYLRCVECYDPVLRQWVPKPDMKVARSFVAVAAVGKYLYAIGKFINQYLIFKFFLFFEFFALSLHVLQFSRISLVHILFNNVI